MTTGIYRERGRFSRTCRCAVRFVGTIRWFRCAAPPANFFAGLRPGDGRCGQLFLSPFLPPGNLLVIVLPADLRSCGGKFPVMNLHPRQPIAMADGPKGCVENLHVAVCGIGVFVFGTGLLFVVGPYVLASIRQPDEDYLRDGLGIMGIGALILAGCWLFHRIFLREDR